MTASCYTLIPEADEECVSYQATMTGDIIGLDDTLDTVALMAQQLNSDAVTATTENIRILFLGTQLDYGDTGRDVLPPAKNVVQETFSASFENNRFTVIGIAIVTGLTMAILGLVYVIVRRKRSTERKSFEHQEFEDEDIKSTPPENKDDDDDDTGSDSKDISRDVDGEILNNDDNLPESPDEFDREYAFDLGGWMKSELLGIHGANTITAQPSKGGAEEGLSDSDNDSWAQTEGTIGSLELRLEPIEAEV